MKVLLVNNFFCPVGGAENSTNKTGILLEEKGHDVYFFATNREPYFQKEYKYSKYFPKYQDFSGLNKFEITKYIKNPSYFYNIEAEKNLDLYLKEIKPDVVHLNCITYYLSPSIINACTKNKVPIVMTIRDPFIACPNTGFLYKSEEYCKDQLCVGGNPLNCIIGKCNDNSFFKSFISVSEFIFRRIHKLYDKVSIFICTSNAILELAKRSGISKNKLILINNFLDNEFLETKPEYNNEGYFLYSGRLAKEKGVIKLLKAMNKLPEIPLRIVGDGPEKENLMNFTKKLDMKNVEFVGFKDGQDLLNEYKGCIASIIPSNYFEAFGMTILESFAYGKPVIGSNVGGIPEIIENGIDGLIFEPENVYKLADLIYILYSDQQLATQMGINGRKKVQEHYNSEIYYSKLLNVYRSVVISQGKDKDFTNKRINDYKSIIISEGKDENFANKQLFQ